MKQAPKSRLFFVVLHANCVFNGFPTLLHEAHLMHAHMFLTRKKRISAVSMRLPQEADHSRKLITTQSMPVI